MAAIRLDRRLTRFESAGTHSLGSTASPGLGRKPNKDGAIQGSATTAASTGTHGRHEKPVWRAMRRWTWMYGLATPSPLSVPPSRHLTGGARSLNRESHRGASW